MANVYYFIDSASGPYDTKYKIRFSNTQYDERGKERPTGMDIVAIFNREGMPSTKAAVYTSDGFVFPEDASNFFARASYVDLSNVSTWDFSSITNMSGFFKQLPYQKELNLCGIKLPSNVNLSEMFSGCKYLETVKVTLGTNGDNDIRVGDDMFYNCISITNWDGNTGIDKANDQGGYFTGVGSWIACKLYIKV